MTQPMILDDLPERLSFSKETPWLQLAWDSTSMGTFMECPRKYYYNILRGFTPKSESIHLAFGGAYHKALEIYDHEKFSGKSHDEAQLAATRYCLEETWDKALGKPKVLYSEDSNKNRFTLVRTVVWYLEQFGAEDPIETVRLANGKPAVELSFRMPLSRQSLTGEDYWLCGHMDRLGILNDQVWVIDRKTSKYQIDQTFFEKFTPDNQFSTYVSAGKVVYQIPVQGLIVDGAQIAVTFSRFYRGIVPRSEPMLEEWLQEIHLYIDQAERYAEIQYWPMNPKACGNYGGCAFRDICSKAPQSREMWLKANYIKRIWDPLVVRGDV